MDSHPWPFFVTGEGSNMPNLSKQIQPHAAVRDSQIELLRIIAMVMMLILHANFLGIRVPEYVDFLQDSVNAWSRMGIEAFCIVAVDVFVLISGWYGIQFRKCRLVSYIFQVYFFTFVLYFASLFFDSELPPTPQYVAHLVIMDPYWFARSYLLLYLLSPVLNKMTDYLHHLNSKWSEGTPLLIVIVLYALVQSVFGWYGNCRLWGNEGDSVFTFVFLYFVGRWLRLYGHRITHLPRWIYVSIYFILCLAVAFMGGRAILHNNTDGCFFWYKNTSLPVIVAAISLFLFFQRLSFHNFRVNMLAASCFAVYLFNCSPSLFELYKGLSAYFLTMSSGARVLFCAVVLISTYFFVAVLLDQLRKFLWNIIEENLCVKL